MADQICRHCGAAVREFNYALGPEWMHVDPNASFPTTGKGTAWRTCRAETVAEPMAAAGQGSPRDLVHHYGYCQSLTWCASCEEAPGDTR